MAPSPVPQSSWPPRSSSSAHRCSSHTLLGAGHITERGRPKASRRFGVVLLAVLARPSRWTHSTARLGADLRSPHRGKWATGPLTGSWLHAETPTSDASECDRGEGRRQGRVRGPYVVAAFQQPLHKQQAGCAACAEDRNFHRARRSFSADRANGARRLPGEGGRRSRAAASEGQRPTEHRFCFPASS
jgi:hypothetical protein